MEIICIRVVIKGRRVEIICIRVVIKGRRVEIICIRVVIRICLVYAYHIFVLLC